MDIPLGKRGLFHGPQENLESRRGWLLGPAFAVSPSPAPSPPVPAASLEPFLSAT